MRGDGVGFEEWFEGWLEVKGVKGFEEIMMGWGSKRLKFVERLGFWGEDDNGGGFFFCGVGGELGWGGWGGGWFRGEEGRD